jgi:hypothetical protein
VFHHQKISATSIFFYIDVYVITECGSGFEISISSTSSKTGMPKDSPTLNARAWLWLLKKKKEKKKKEQEKKRLTNETNLRGVVRRKRFEVKHVGTVPMNDCAKRKTIPERLGKIRHGNILVT